MERGHPLYETRPWLRVDGQIDQRLLGRWASLIPARRVELSAGGSAALGRGTRRCFTAWGSGSPFPDELDRTHFRHNFFSRSKAPQVGEEDIAELHYIGESASSDASRCLSSQRPFCSVTSGRRGEHGKPARIARRNSANASSKLTSARSNCRQFAQGRRFAFQHMTR